MTTQIDLKQIERRAWTMYFDDGLWEIFLGVLLIGMGVRTVTDNVWFTFLALSSVLVWPLGKRLVTIPRVGLAKFGPARRAKQFKITVIIVVAVLATFALWIYAANSGVNLPDAASAAVVGGFITFIFWLLAYFLDFRRLYLYAPLFASTLALSEVFEDPIPGYAALGAGGLILLIGALYLLRFMRRYPKPSLEESDA